MNYRIEVIKRIVGN